MRSLSLDTINVNYTADQFLEIFTDGLYNENQAKLCGDVFLNTSLATQLQDTIDLPSKEANISDDKLKYYQFPGYTLYNLPKYRQVASGILTGVKEDLTSHYDLIKSLGSTKDK
ncbi:unnamed protein product [Rodentolepis nana]|uniref:RNase III domain-containing protein n=1 Tax=Rodentolepis nana TaxID=102285 RepID=A0A0R3TYU2_RODNA|nr:unnamed protein product [Rodentolepis nana]